MAGTRRPYLINVIPAAPDWRLAMPVENEQGEVEALFYEPILAWAVEVHQLIDDSGLFYSVEPITPNGDQDGNWAISPPDRTMIIPADREFENANELLEYWKTSLRRKPRKTVTP